MSSGLTPIRVRGKRDGSKVEKWRSGKVRKHKTGAAASRSILAKESLAGSLGTLRPKRKIVHLSRLEQLPTEMIQAIFVKSGNLGLPLASSNLASQLSGKQLQWELTCSTLDKIVDCQHDAAPTKLDLAMAKRLLDSNFMTWEFFRRWLDTKAAASGSGRETPRSSNIHARTDIDEPTKYADIWVSLQPASGFVPPSKALRGPWTADRISLLRVFALNYGGCTRPLYGVAGETAYEGLEHAIAQRSKTATELLRNLQMQPDQGLLRKAVIDYGCDRETVLYLLQWCATDIYRWSAGSVNPETFCPRLEIDFLDPLLWQWAESASEAGDSTGEWLTKTLKRVSGVIANRDTQGLELLDGVTTH